MTQVFKVVKRDFKAVSLSTKAWYWSFFLGGFLGILVAWVYKYLTTTEPSDRERSPQATWKFVLLMLPIMMVSNFVANILIQLLGAM